MPIDIGSRLNVAVSHPFLHIFQTAAVVQQQTGTAMTKLMEANVRHSVPFKHFENGALHNPEQMYVHRAI